MHLQAGALLKNGEYKIEKVLGQGGFGITYLAEQTSLGRKVALKEFFMEGLCNRDANTSNVSVGSVGSKKLVERFKQKFIKEARMIASFDNNHIISIYDVFEENGTAYYVMEYLGGKSLSAIVNEQGIMSETLAMQYIRQVADALAEVHANNLLHLDVKPANIMLNKKGEAVLIDFGISKHYDEAGNQTSSALIGTSEGYAPIEQYEAGALDSFTPATDIYALGATLFFLLTGTRPPKAGDVMNDGLPELPSEISQTVSGAITAAMQPRRKDRPQSIAEFLCLVENGNVKTENGKLKDESDGETELNGNEEAERKNEKEHSADAVIFRGKPSTARLSVSEESQPANNEILPPFSRQNDKDGKMKAASKREGENLFTHTASESSFDKVKAERRNEKEHSAGVVISNESEKSQKNKPGKSLWLILLLLLIAVAGAWFLFGGTGNGNTPKTDTKKQIVKKDTPTPPQGEEREKPVVKGDSILDANDHSDTSDGTKIEDDKEDGDRNISADQITDGNKVSESTTPTGSETDIKGSGSTVASNNNEEVNKVSDICYNVTDEVNKTVEVAKGKYTGSIVIPKTVVHNDVVYSVTSIGERAFYECKGLTSITIPNSVTSIGDWAFCNCSGLTSIIIPNSVTSIGEGAFSDCSGLTSITIPNSVTSIGIWAFDGCKGLTSITIGNSVKSIGNWAFSHCSGLTSITIPNSVTSIGAFSYCSGLTNIIVDKNNPKYDSRDNCNAIIETKTNELIAGCKNTVIPGNVTSIGYAAFSGCKGLTSITIPNSVTSIGGYAFSHCSGLTSVTIPNSVKSIGDRAFWDCSGLTNIIVDKNNPKYDSRDNCNAIIETKTNELIAGCKNTVIPGNVTSIGDFAFNDCSGLTSITIPNSVTSIGWCAFSGCKGLTSITIPNSVTSIETAAFSDCSGLTSITIPNSVTSIGVSAFEDCDGLTNVIKPDGISIGKDAFKGTPWLKKQK